jgi:hypothetical protein
MLNVYMTGVIYFNGCNETDKRVYAPDGTTYTPRHYASLWIAQEDVEGDDWWPEDKIVRPVGGGLAFEYRIPSPVTLSFPGSGDASCTGLDGGLSKLKKEDKGSEVDLEVSPNPATIAQIPIHGGAIKPRLYKGIRLVGWVIDDAGTQIAAESASESRTITVRNGAEVVFTNIPELPVHGKDSHISLFNQLTVQPGSLKANGPTGPANPITGNDAILDRIRFGVLGNTPGCCRG